MSPQKTKKIDRKWYDIGMEYLVYSMVIIIPIVFSPAFYTAFSASKLLALRLITIAIILLWGLKVFVEGSFSYRKSKLNFLLLIYGLITIITTLFSSNIFTSLLGEQGRFLGLFTLLNLLLLPFFVLNILKDKQRIRNLLLVSLITSSVLAVYGILQHFGLWQEQFNWNLDPADRVFGTVGHGNHFGAYLAMNFVLGIFLIKDFKADWRKILLGFGLVLQLITIFLTASRGAIIALLVALIASGLCIAFNKAKNGTFNIGRWIAPAFILIALIVSGSVIFQDEINKIPLIERTNATLESISQGKLPDRVSWWLSATEMIKDRPLFGYGLSTFRDKYNSYRRLDYETLEEGDQETQIVPETAHNEYLNIAATQGILGLISFLAIIGFVLFRIQKILFRKEDDNYDYTLMGLKGALIVYLVQVLISFGVITTLSVFFIYLGAALALTENKPIEKNVTLKAGAKYLVILLIIVLVAFGLLGTVKGALAEYYYKTALEEGSAYNLDAALGSFEKTISNNPWEYSYHQAMGDFALQFAQPISAFDTRMNLLETAVDQYEQALALNDNYPSLYFNLGVTQLQIHALTRKEIYYIAGAKSFDIALEKSPNNPLYPYQVAKAYSNLNRSDSSVIIQKYLNQALELRPGYRDSQELLNEINAKQALLQSDQ